MTEEQQAPSARSMRHTALEDTHAIIMGGSFVAFGLVLLKSAGLVTGGVAGIALIVSYLTGWPVGTLFVALNLPFFLLAQQRLGWRFMLKSIVTIVFLAALTALMPGWFTLRGIDPIFAAVFGGSLIGMGVLALARHRASVGGIGILAIYLQQSRSISAGKTQMAFDVFIVGGSLLTIDAQHMVYSIISAAALNIVMIAYHRPGRYMG